MSKNISMKPVSELPQTRRGRQSMYVEVVSKLAAKPGQAFEVRTYNSASAAQSGRQALVKAAKAAGVGIEAVASGSTLFAKANGAARKRAAARPGQKKGR